MVRAVRDFEDAVEQKDGWLGHGSMIERVESRFNYLRA